MIFISILFVSLILISGCISQTTNPPPMTGPQPPAHGDPSVHSGGLAIAIAFKTDEISTTSPDAKELFIKGLTFSTQYARYNDSLAYFDAALALDQNFTEAWVAKGVALHNLKRYDEAIENYNTALTFSPTDAGIWHVKGITLRDWGSRRRQRNATGGLLRLIPGTMSECNDTKIKDPSDFYQLKNEKMSVTFDSPFPMASLCEDVPVPNWVSGLFVE